MCMLYIHVLMRVSILKYWVGGLFVLCSELSLANHLRTNLLKIVYLYFHVCMVYVSMY